MAHDDDLPEDTAPPRLSASVSFRRYLLGATVVAVGAACAVVGYITTLGATSGKAASVAPVAALADDGDNVPNVYKGRPVASQDRRASASMVPPNYRSDVARARDCGSNGHERWGRAVAMNPGTTCDFARAVRDVYLRANASGEVTVVAYSKPTRKVVAMRCVVVPNKDMTNEWAVCQGGKGARVALGGM